MSGASAGAVIAVAAAQKRLRDQEEEEMTQYNPQDLHDWEFKILRATTFSGFRNPYVLKKVIDEESKAGWILVEKFDDARLRFKRKITHREGDSKLTIYPYRSIYGPSQNMVIVWVLFGSIGFTLLIMFFVALLVH